MEIIITILLIAAGFLYTIVDAQLQDDNKETIGIIGVFFILTILSFVDFTANNININYNGLGFLVFFWMRYIGMFGIGYCIAKVLMWLGKQITIAGFKFLAAAAGEEELEF